MRKHTVLMCVLACVLFGFLCTASSPGAEGILGTDVSGTSLVMNELALRDTVSYTPEPTDWTIYFHPGIRFGTDDRVIGFYDVLVPVYLSDNSMLFVNPRFSHDSNDGHEWNLGGGYRQILWNNQLMLGINAYYDIKKEGDSGTYFDQWGMGFEAMGEFDNVLASGGGLGLTGRFNFYVPLSGSKSIGAGGFGGGYRFSSLGIYSAGGGTVYEPLTGLDYEMGMRIPYLSNYVETWAYGGGYHYWGRESGHLDGFCGRIEVIPTDFLALDFEYRNDNWQGDEFYGEVKVEVPFSIGNLVQGKNPFEGLGSRFGGSRTLAERMVEPVRRDIDIRIREVTSGDGTGSVGGLIEDIIFVSEGATAGAGDGTFENPYASIAEAYADPRVGVTAFTIHVINDDTGDMVAGGGDITGGGVANLLIWGSGAPHPVYGSPGNMTPGFPEINTTLTIDDDGAEILGLSFNNAGNICLTNAGASGISIHNNIFAGDYGVFSYRGSGINISSNTFNGCGYGIYLHHHGFDVENLTITKNNITASRCGIAVTTGAGGHIGTSGNPVLIDDNTITVNVSVSTDAHGIYLFSGDNIFADVTNNHMSVSRAPTSPFSGMSYGIFIYSSNGHLGYDGSAINPVWIYNNEIAVVSNNLSSQYTYGIYLSSGAVSSALYAEITHNDMTGGITSATSRAYAAYLESNATIGSTAYPLLFQNNIGTIDGNIARYVMWLDNNNFAGDSYINWTGSVFTPLNGGASSTWSGNEPAGFGTMNNSFDTTNYSGTIHHD